MATHRRFASESATAAAQRRPRPLSILSPPLSQNARFSMFLPAQFEEIILQLEEKKEKIYYEGYLQKLEVSASSTRLQKDGGWQEVYASLSGTVLSTWPAADLDLADTIGALSKVPPAYINLMDARIDQHDSSHHLVITTAGNKQVRLRASHGSGESDIARWLLAIRLSAFERSRMQEAYTANLFLKFQTKETTNLPSTEEAWSGYVDARICGGDVVQTQWCKFWCCITTSRRKNSLTKRLPSFGSSKVETEMQFFTDKRDKAPRIVMHDIFAAYACYPEHMSLIETAGVVKLEGNVHLKTSGPRPNSEGFALIIPAVPEKSKRLSITSSPKPVTLVQSILRFLYAVWSTFHLYNMPSQLLLNANHIDALGLNGAMLDFKLDRVRANVPPDCTTDRSWKTFLRREAYASQSSNTMSRSTSQMHENGSPAFRRTGSDRRVVSEGAIRMTTGRPLVTSIEEDEENERLAALQTQPAVDASYSHLLPQVALVGAGRQAIQPETDEHIEQFAKLDRSASPFNGLDSVTGPQASPKLHTSDRRHSKNSHGSSTSSVLDSTLQALGPGPNNTLKHSDAIPKRSFESPMLPRVTPDNDSEYTPSQPAIKRIISDHFSPQPHRPSIPGRIVSHDSHQSEVSESSVYSAGLDLATLDLVSPFPAEGEQQAHPYAIEREESIYSAADDRSDYASTIGETSLSAVESHTVPATMRFDAASALDIMRQPARTSPANPYARPRPRVN